MDVGEKTEDVAHEYISLMEEDNRSLDSTLPDARSSQNALLEIMSGLRVLPGADVISLFGLEDSQHTSFCPRRHIRIGAPLPL